MYEGNIDIKEYEDDGLNSLIIQKLLELENKLSNFLLNLLKKIGYIFS